MPESKPGGRLRTELTRRLSAESLPAPNKPSKETLSNDFRVLKRPAD
jgi:hypothetical protein